MLRVPAPIAATAASARVVHPQTRTARWPEARNRATGTMPKGAISRPKGKTAISELAKSTESAPLAAPCYSPEWAGGVFAVVRDWLAPAVLGADIDSGRQLQQRLAVFKGNPFAKAALDNAWWSLYASATGQPLQHRFWWGSWDCD